ncbi:hypothetical protein [Haloferula rosea]|uniref:Uncharacterized protein n=1 Tax=Haloferula rosea TaxID=490093 RepID=A0A934VF48_9BACT|nr:hypothetical protein [Haloferula rosea]MBK1827989.1 hypothetical protein [Haloferula rosea]
MGRFGNIFGSKIETPEEAIRRGRMAQGKPPTPPPMPGFTPPRPTTDFRATAPPTSAPPPLPEILYEDQDDLETRAIRATFSPPVFHEWIAAIDQRLTRGFSDLQRQTLATKVGRLGNGDSVVMHYNLFHGGSPCDLKLTITRSSPELLAIRADGPGPGMDLLLEECSGRASIFGELQATEDDRPRDGRFRRDPDGRHWRSRLPLEWGSIFDYPLEVIVEQGRPGMIGGGEIWDTPLLRALHPLLPMICSQVESKLRENAGDTPLRREELRPPEAILSAQVSDPLAWFIRMRCSEGIHSDWRIDLHGIDIQGVGRQA